MKKVLALLLALLTLLPLILACQDPSDEPEDSTGIPETAAPGETEDPFDDKVPQFDFKEREFLFSAPNPIGDTYFDRAETKSEAVNDAVYTRNRLLESRFNITITALNVEWTHNQAQGFAPYAIAGEDVIDVIGAATAQSGIPLITEGYVIPWNDIPYINLDKPWWNKSVSKTLAVLGNYYYLSGDVVWNTMNVTAAYFFNKEVAEDHKELVGDLYQTVRDGDWTQELVLNYCKALSSDNGDGVWDEKDTYGLLQYKYTIESYVYGSDYQTVYMTNDGPVLNYSTTKLQSILDWAYTLLCENHYARVGEEYESDIFFDNRALFMNGNISVAVGWRAQETDFGILPLPKYNKEQKDYVTYSDQWGLTIALPCTASDLSRTGAVLEAMAAQSRKLIVPALYDQTLLGKVKRDTESEEMLDILYANNLYDIGRAFATSDSYLPLRQCITGKNKNLTSWYKSYKKKLQNNYDSLYQYVKALKEGE